MSCGAAQGIIDANAQSRGAWLGKVKTSMVNISCFVLNMNNNLPYLSCSDSNNYHNQTQQVVL